MKLSNIFKYLSEEKVKNKDRMMAELETVQNADFLKLNSAVSRLETAKTNLLVVEELMDFLTKNPDTEKANFLQVLNEMLVTSTAFTNMDSTSAKKAKKVAELYTTFNSNRF